MDGRTDEENELKQTFNSFRVHVLLHMMQELLYLPVRIMCTVAAEAAADDATVCLVPFLVFITHCSYQSMKNILNLSKGLMLRQKSPLFQYIE